MDRWLSYTYIIDLQFISDIPNDGRYVPWLLFAISSMVAGFAGLFLPETVGRKLPETLEDAEDQELDDAWLNKINAVIFGKKGHENGTV